MVFALEVLCLPVGRGLQNFCTLGEGVIRRDCRAYGMFADLDRCSAQEGECLVFAGAQPTVRDGLQELFVSYRALAGTLLGTLHGTCNSR